MPASLSSVADSFSSGFEPAHGPAPRGSGDQPSAWRAQQRSTRIGDPSYPGYCATARHARSTARRRAGSLPRLGAHAERKSARRCSASGARPGTPRPRPRIRQPQAGRLTSIHEVYGEHRTVWCGSAKRGALRPARGGCASAPTHLRGNEGRVSIAWGSLSRSRRLGLRGSALGLPPDGAAAVSRFGGWAN